MCSHYLNVDISITWGMTFLTALTLIYCNLNIALSKTLLAWSGAFERPIRRTCAFAIDFISISSDQYLFKGSLALMSYTRDGSIVSSGFDNTRLKRFRMRERHHIYNFKNFVDKSRTSCYVSEIFRPIRSWILHNISRIYKYCVLRSEIATFTYFCYVTWFLSDVIYNTILWVDTRFSRKTSGRTEFLCSVWHLSLSSTQCLLHCCHQADWFPSLQLYNVVRCTFDLLDNHI